MRPFLVLAALSAGCVPKIEDDLSAIGKPRVLAVRAAADCEADRCPAEIDPTGPSRAKFEALVATSDGAAQPELVWNRCDEPKPLTELGPVSPKCLSRNPDPDVALFIGSGLRVNQVDIPDEACRFFGPDAPPPTKDGPGGRPTDPDLSGGFYQPVVAFLGDEPSLGALRLDCAPDNVEYRARYRANENPAIDSLTIGTTVVSPIPESTQVAPGKHVTFQANWASCPRTTVPGTQGCTGAETYAWSDPAARAIVDRRESIRVSCDEPERAMLTMKTRYALRALAYLANAPSQQPPLAREIARDAKIPKKFLERVLADLAQHAIIRSRKGRGGGYYLAKPASDISVFSVMRVCQGSVAPLLCLERRDWVCDGCDRTCPLRLVLSAPYEAYAKSLDAATIEELAWCDDATIRRR
jgi:Rrf2 family protein